MVSILEHRKGDMDGGCPLLVRLEVVLMEQNILHMRGERVVMTRLMITAKWKIEGRKGEFL